MLARPEAAAARDVATSPAGASCRAAGRAAAAAAPAGSTTTLSATGHAASTYSSGRCRVGADDDGQHGDQRGLRRVQADLIPQQRLPEHAELGQQDQHRDDVRAAGVDAGRRCDRATSATSQVQGEHAEHGEQERRGGELGDLEQAQLGERVVDHRDHRAQRARLGEQRDDGQQPRPPACGVAASPHGATNTLRKIVYRISCFADDPHFSSAK